MIVHSNVFSTVANLLWWYLDRVGSVGNALHGHVGSTDESSDDGNGSICRSVLHRGICDGKCSVLDHISSGTST